MNRLGCKYRPPPVVFRGFTLIELLVVIAIIALLISVLLPSLNSARALGKQATCLSNMKNMMVAVDLYANDHGDAYPLSRAHGGFAQGGWIKSLKNYVGSEMLYRCPADQSDNWFVEGVTPPGKARINSYATNVYMSPAVRPPRGAPDPRPLYGFTKRSLVPSPGDTIFLGEIRDTRLQQIPEDHIHADRWVPGLTGVPAGEPSAEIAIGRHSKKKENYAYADGHAMTHKINETFLYDEIEARVVRDHWDPRFRQKQQDARKGE